MKIFKNMLENFGSYIKKRDTLRQELTWSHYRRLIIVREEEFKHMLESIE